MKSKRPLKIVFFKTATGHEPVRAWLKSLPREECKIIGTDILTVQYAWPIGKPLVDSLGGGMWEICSRLVNRIARTLFTEVDQELVLLHGFIKQTPKAPAQDLDQARKRLNLYLKAL